MPDGFLHILCEALAVLTDVQTYRRFIDAKMGDGYVTGKIKLWEIC